MFSVPLSTSIVPELLKKSTPDTEDVPVPADFLNVPELVSMPLPATVPSAWRLTIPPTAWH